MTEAIEYEQFDKTASGVAGALPDPDLDRLSDIPMQLSVEIGRAHMTVGETLELRVGSVLALERQAGEAADLLVNGTAIARGEVIVIDEQYGLKVTEILDGQQEGELHRDDHSEPSPADAPEAPAAGEEPPAPGAGEG